MGELRKRRQELKTQRDGEGCAACGETIACSVAFIELKEDIHAENFRLGTTSVATETITIGRSTTAYLCKGCGNVVFDFLAGKGFLSKAKFYEPEKAPK